MSKEKFDIRFNEAWNMQAPYVANVRNGSDVRLLPNVEVASPATPPENGEKLYPAWVVSALREKLRSLSYGPEQGRPFVLPHPPFEFKVPTEETLEIRLTTYDAEAQQVTQQVIGQVILPIEPERFKSQEEDPHPPSRGCGCVDCVEDFAEKDSSPRDHKFYEASSSVPEWNETNAQTALIMALKGTRAQQEAARAFFTRHLNTAPAAYLRQVSISLGGVPPDGSIKNQITLVFTQPLDYQKFEDNAVGILFNNSEVAPARKYMERIIEAQYLQQFGQVIDTRQLTFTFTNKFVNELPR